MLLMKSKIASLWLQLEKKDSKKRKKNVVEDWRDSDVYLP